MASFFLRAILDTPMSVELRVSSSEMQLRSGKLWLLANNDYLMKSWSSRMISTRVFIRKKAGRTSTVYNVKKFEV